MLCGCSSPIILLRYNLCPKITVKNQTLLCSQRQLLDDFNEQSNHNRVVTGSAGCRQWRHAVVGDGNLLVTDEDSSLLVATGDGGHLIPIGDGGLQAAAAMAAAFWLPMGMAARWLSSNINDGSCRQVE